MLPLALWQNLTNDLEGLYLEVDELSQNELQQAKKMATGWKEKLNKLVGSSSTGVRDNNAQNLLLSVSNLEAVISKITKYQSGLATIYVGLSNKEKATYKNDYENHLARCKGKVSALRLTSLTVTAAFVEIQQTILQTISNYIPVDAIQNTLPQIKENFLSRFDLYLTAVCNDVIPKLLKEKINASLEGLDVVAFQDLASKLRPQNIIEKISTMDFAGPTEEIDAILGYHRTTFKYFPPDAKRRQENRHFETLAVNCWLQQVAEKLKGIDAASFGAEASERLNKIQEIIDTTLSAIERDFGKFELSRSGDIQIS